MQLRFFSAVGLFSLASMAMAMGCALDSSDVASHDDVTTAADSAALGTSIPLTLTADRGPATSAVVSTGVPFSPGVLRDAALVAVRDASNREIPVYTSVLARWPADGSIRSVLVAFRATLASGAKAAYTISYGTARTTAALAPLAPNPDGPVAATLSPAWYAASLVSGRNLPAASDTRFPGYESDVERKITAMSPAYETYGTSCDSTSNKRSYYDGPHALYQRFLRYGDFARYRRARGEAVWYRGNELRWFEGRAMATQICQSSSWTPSTALNWAVLRTMLGQGMLDDYLMTGDPKALEAVVAIGEAYRRNLPALTSGTRPAIEATERNLAWPMMGLASAYAATGRADFRDALTGLVNRAIAWQARSASGAFEHDINRPDPSECERGARGASPFMTSILVDGLMQYHELTRDARIAEVVRKVAVWYETKAITSDRRTFRYLWGCDTDSYDNSDYADLNLLMAHVFGAAYSLTKDTHWLDFGDHIADSGVDAMYVGRPKQWNQASRSFGKYLGYRAVARTP